jgi:hypothetical protein
MLTKLAERGVETIAVGCREHGGYEQFVEAIETERRDLEASGLLELHGLEDTDHIFSPIWAQEWLSELLMSVLERLGADDRKEDPSSLRVGG